MTLLEILIAISISTLVMGVALSVYVTVSGSLRRQNEARWDDALSALAVLRHDLATSSPATFSNAPAFQLDPSEDDGGSALAFCVADLREEEEDFSRLEIRRNLYRLQATDPASAPALTRETVTLWGAEALGAPLSNTLLKAATRFDVAVLEGDTWTNRWQSKPGHLLPRAARVRLDWTTAYTTQTASIVVLIPAGNSLIPQAANRPPR